MSTQVITLNADNFQQHLSAQSGVVLIDFWADWCNPCRQLAPIVDEIAETYADEVSVCKLNTESESALSDQFNVKALPTLIVFVNGEEQQRLIGLNSKTRISQLLEQYIG